MPNLLANENSPYLIQHANNPVEWYPWGPEALERARHEDRPIFLSIGYAACHWCHVMAHESFEDIETAALMNENFVNIKVDREERPDLDNIYMNAVVAMTGSGGWPMSVFLMPDGRPFYGGTYFPPVRRYNMPSFREVLSIINRMWREDRQRLLASVEEIVNHLAGAQSLTFTGEPLDPSVVDQAAFRLAQAYDWQHGGWGQAPKFPQPMAIVFLLGRAHRGDSLALDVCRHALDAMARGGMYDVIGGGFARYSTDNDWLVPHFEKMLYDNAQLARAYLHAYLITGSEAYHQVCTETLDFIIREMRAEPEGVHLGGGFFSSLDADSEGEEGKFYVWRLDEIQAALAPDSLEAANLVVPASVDANQFFIDAYGITRDGNFEGATVLQRQMDHAALAERYGIPVEQVAGLLRQLHAHLYQLRSQRIWPGIDDKVLVAWNALALTVFAEAARYLKRSDYLEIARSNATFLLTELSPAGQLQRSWRKGVARHPTYLEDHAALILGLLALYQSDADPAWFAHAVYLAEEMLAHFSDPEGGFFDTSDEQEALILRPKDVQDNATPSGNALAALALLHLSAYTGASRWRDQAESMLGGIQKIAVQHPTAFAQWLVGLDFALQPIQEVAILGPDGSPGRRSLIAVLWESIRPFSLAAISDYPPPAGSPPLLDDRPLIDNQPTAYVCRNFACLRPVTEPDEFREQLQL